MKADLRSDTITKPRPEMLDFMVQAPVGDDCYGDDPTVNELQQECASMFGKEAALFTCSGTMSNQLALKAHTQPGDEIILEKNYHINFFESGPSAHLAQIVLNPVHTEDGVLTPALIEDAINAKPRSPIYSNPRLICLENTIAYYGGKIFPFAVLGAIRTFALKKDMKVHMDGARILNACVATGISPEEYAKCADTVSLCFAKGLGAPFGSILMGDEETINRAKMFRKWYGGGLHQAGFMAAGALYGLRNAWPRLQDDHAKSRLLNNLLKQSEFSFPVSENVDTNIVIFDIKKTSLSAPEFVHHMETRGVCLFPWLGSQVRAVTHQDVSYPEIEWAAKEIMLEAAKLAHKNNQIVYSFPAPRESTIIRAAI